MCHAKRQIIYIVDKDSLVARQMPQETDADETEPACYKDMLHHSPAMEFVMPVFPSAKRFAKTRLQKVVGHHRIHRAGRRLRKLGGWDGLDLC